MIFLQGSKGKRIVPDKDKTRHPVSQTPYSTIGQNSFRKILFNLVPIVGIFHPKGVAFKTRTISNKGHASVLDLVLRRVERTAQYYCELRH